MVWRPCIHLMTESISINMRKFPLIVVLDQIDGIFNKVINSPRSCFSWLIFLVKFFFVFRPLRWDNALNNSGKFMTLHYFYTDRFMLLTSSILQLFLYYTLLLFFFSGKCKIQLRHTLKKFRILCAYWATSIFILCIFNVYT